LTQLSRSASCRLTQRLLQFYANLVNYGESPTLWRDE